MDVPDGWQLWSDEGDRVVCAYRPDVFDGADFPAPCLPTVYVTRGRRGRRPGERTDADRWFVALYLEPDVSTEQFHGDRAAALAAAEELMADFAAGEVDYRALYQVPREEYFERLDDLTGRGQR
jgi:hypothetical protein